MCASLFTCRKRRMFRKTETAIFPPHPGNKLAETTVVNVGGLSHLAGDGGDIIILFKKHEDFK